MKDRMLDMGFYETSNEFEYCLLKTKLIVLQFFNRHQEIMGILHHPVHVEATPKTRPWMLLSKKYILLPKRKTELIIKLIEGNWKQILVSPVPNKALIN
jgi:ATP-dependent RNA helicase RhlE